MDSQLELGSGKPGSCCHLQWDTGTCAIHRALPACGEAFAEFTVAV